MAYKIDQTKCIGCHTCMGVCPAMAIGDSPDGKCVIDPTKCMSCGTCAAMCPVSAIAAEH
ncbi:MAG: 4Fe-4S binding protein [Alphaproteobacteria bacterium]|nr:4Fe-4S binding protein [Alphaproteobacteria bacterium]